MEPSYDPIASIGLRHVIEDSIDRLTGARPVDDQRAAFALESVRVFLLRALRGAEMTSTTSHSVQAGDMSALEIYSRMLDYLDDTYQDKLTVQLQGVAQALLVKAQGQTLSESQNNKAVSFLEDFLGKIKREGTYKKQSEPELIRAGRQ